jgi:hypothetical protein
MAERKYGRDCLYAFPFGNPYAEAEKTQKFVDEMCMEMSSFNPKAVLLKASFLRALLWLYD